MDELFNRISSKLSTNDTNHIWITLIDLDYACGQMNLAPETCKHSKFTNSGKKIKG